MQLFVFSIVIDKWALRIYSIWIEGFLFEFIENLLLNILIAAVNDLLCLHYTLYRFINIFVIARVVEYFEAFLLVLPFFVILMSYYQKVAIYWVMDLNIF